MFYIGAFLEFNGAPKYDTDYFLSVAQSHNGIRSSFVLEWEASRKLILDELGYLKSASFPIPDHLLAFLCNDRFIYESDNDQSIRSRFPFPNVLKHHHLYTAYIKAFLEG